MKCLRALLATLLLTVLATAYALAQSPPVSNCKDNTRDPLDPPPGIDACNQTLLMDLGSGDFHAQPFLDTVADGNGHWPDYLDPDHNVVSLYGVYGNNEKTTSSGSAAYTHYQQGVALANQITPLCKNPNTCSDASKAIVFLFIGFSNTDIEIGGGNSDDWDGTADTGNTDPANHSNGHLFGQACSTHTENLNNPDGRPAWNQVTFPLSENYTQQSLLYQVYSGTRLVGPHVVLWDGALGQQTLNKWDPTPIGYYAINKNCTLTHGDEANPECNWVRVNEDLQRNGFSEYQVQAIFIKDSNTSPHCDLKHAFWDLTCTQPPPPLLSQIDAYQAEQYLGNILRYAKCCKLNPDGTSSGIPRYPNLRQVFITSRIYGGWANGNVNGCINPEPFAYELAFTVQRAIVAQINQDANITNNDLYSGTLNYKSDGTGSAPWFDWAPYLWADGVNPTNLRSDGLVWCNWSTRPNPLCNGDPGDVRFGDLDSGYTQFYGDQNHPTGWGTLKVAGQFLKWIQNTLPSSQSYLSDWFGYGSVPTPWIMQ